jgi:hypothetical protein
MGVIHIKHILKDFKWCSREILSEQVLRKNRGSRGDPLFFRLLPAPMNGSGACPERSEGTGVGVDLLQLIGNTIKGRKIKSYLEGFSNIEIMRILWKDYND